MEENLPYREVTHHIRFAREEAASVIPYRIISQTFIGQHLCRGDSNRALSISGLDSPLC